MSALGDDAPRSATFHFSVDVRPDANHPRPIVVDMPALSGAVSPVGALQIAEHLERQAARLRAAVAVVNAVRVS